MLAALEDYYGRSGAENSLQADYEIRKCTTCTLEFSWPMTGGSPEFYSWITMEQDYYPAFRWEWGEVGDWLARQPRAIRLLEIGCGSGSFLESIRPLDNVAAVGIDFTEASVAICRGKSLDVHRQTLEEFSARQHEFGNKFDAVVAFHCLEHVTDPLGLIRDMSQLLSADGRIFVSTPYSPMSIEAGWFDPLNHPPHHLTRWNERAYRELGTQLQLHPTFRMPKAVSLWRRIVDGTLFAGRGRRHSKKPPSVVAAALINPLGLIQNIVAQIRRDRVDGVVASDVVLVEFSKQPPVVA